MTREGDPDRVGEPDVEIGACVTARALRFRSEPSTRVELHGEVTERGCPREDVETASGSERENLPEQVEPGVVYRDVEIRWRASARLPDPRLRERR